MLGLPLRYIPASSGMVSIHLCSFVRLLALCWNGVTVLVTVGTCVFLLYWLDSRKDALGKCILVLFPFAFCGKVLLCSPG